MNTVSLTTQYLARLNSTLLLPVGIFLIGTVLAYGMGAMEEVRLRNSEHAKVALELSNLDAKLEKYIGSAFNEVGGIAQLLSADGYISLAHLRVMTQGATDSAPYINHVVIAPNDIVSDVYPLNGNEALLHLDYRTQKGQYPLLEKARLAKSPLIAGPLQLYQGGRAIIYRCPIFLSRRNEQESYWGSISVVADVDRLLEAGGINDHEGLAIALRGHDGLGEAGAVIHGDLALFKSNSIQLSVTIPGGSWQLNRPGFRGGRFV